MESCCVSVKVMARSACSDVKGCFEQPAQQSETTIDKVVTKLTEIFKIKIDYLSTRGKRGFFPLALYSYRGRTLFTLRNSLKIRFMYRISILHIESVQFSFPQFF